MKLSLVIMAFMALVAYSTAIRVSDINPGPFPDHSRLHLPRPNDVGENSKDARQHPLVRQKRFTCDLLSFGARGVSGFNHAACAAKCVAQRHLGGHCDGAECKCVSKKW